MVRVWSWGYGLALGFIFCFYFVSAKLWTGDTIAPPKPLPSPFWWQNRHCLNTNNTKSHVKRKPIFSEH